MMSLRLPDLFSCCRRAAPEPSEPTDVLKVRKRTFEQIQSSLEGPPAKRQRTIAVPTVEIQVQIAENLIQTFCIPRNALFLLSPHFKKAFKTPMLESLSQTMKWGGPLFLDRPFIHPEAVEYILQFARLKSGYIEEEDFQDLPALQKKFGEETFQVILFDAARLCTYFEINDLKERLVKFLALEIRSEKLFFYFQWALESRQRELLLAAIRLLTAQRRDRLKVYPVLIRLYHADDRQSSLEEKLAWQRLVHHAFTEALPEVAEGEELIQIARCFLEIFPRFDATSASLRKISKYDSKAIQYGASEANQDEALALYVIAICKSALYFYPQSVLSRDRQYTMYYEVYSMNMQVPNEIGFKSFLSKYPDNILILKKFGDWYFDQGKYPSCMEISERILQLRPDHSGALINRSRCHFKEGRRDLAFQDVNLALELDPDEAEALLWRSHYFYSEEDCSAAIKDLDTAIQLDPKNPSAFLERAECLVLCGDLDVALKDLKQAFLLKPYDFEIVTEIGKIYSSKNLLDAALEFYDRVIELSPFKGYRLRGECLYKKGRFQDAIDDFTRALNFDRGPVTFSWRAQCYLRINEMAKAKRDIESALALDPNCEEALAIKAQYF